MQLGSNTFICVYRSVTQRVIYEGQKGKEPAESGSWSDGLDYSFSNEDTERESDWGYLWKIKPKVLANELDKDG